MAIDANQIKQSIDDLMRSTPLVAAAYGIAKVGEKAQEVYEAVKKRVGPSPRPPPKKGDVSLPKDQKKKDVESHSIYQRSR